MSSSSHKPWAGSKLHRATSPWSPQKWDRPTAVSVLQALDEAAEGMERPQHRCQGPRLLQKPASCERRRLHQSQCEYGYVCSLLVSTPISIRTFLEVCLYHPNSRIKDINTKVIAITRRAKGKRYGDGINEGKRCHTVTHGHGVAEAPSPWESAPSPGRLHGGEAAATRGRRATTGRLANCGDACSLCRLRVAQPS